MSDIALHTQGILILDFGSQYAQLIARTIRNLHVYCELMPSHITEAHIRAFKPAGIILSGGPERVSEISTLRAPSIVFELGCPVLGICYGMQTMAIQLGGEVIAAPKAEFGKVELNIKQNDGLFTGIVDSTHSSILLEVWMSHGDMVSMLPPGFSVIATTNNAPYAGIADCKRRFFGLQFHPEVTHTQAGTTILSNFVKNICGCIPRWTMRNIIEESIHTIRQQVGNEKVLVGLSGGLDSMVTALLMHQAIADRLVCVLVDTGLLRKNEADEVMLACSQQGIRVTRLTREIDFLKALTGITDPEEKRKIIGALFIKIFEEHAQTLEVQWLGQGTIYPDVIESAQTHTGMGAVIKTHHNVGGLPSVMRLKLIEPLRELFKDEVRALALELQLPNALIERHPFPGPGLAVRIVGAVKREYVDIVRQADAIFMEALQEQDLYRTVSQAFAVLLPIRSVGVKGDARHYGYIIALRAVTTVDFMTAEWADLPHTFLSHVSHRIVNEIIPVARVVYDISHKPPATVEWE